MRILVIHNEYLERGGEDSEVEAEIALLRHAGHQVEVFLRSNHEISSFSFFQKIGFFVGEMEWSGDMFREVSALIDSFKPDVAHVHNTFVRISPSIYEALWQKRIPVVQSFHNYRMLCPIGTFYRNGAVCEDCLTRGKKSAVHNRCWKRSRFMSWKLTRIIERMERQRVFFDKVRAAIVPTQFAKDKFISAGFPKDRLFLKPNLVEVPQLPDGRTPKGGHALFIGRLADYKGIQQLAKIFEQCPQVSLKIVGDGPLREEIESAARTVKNVELLGRLDYPQMVREVAQAGFVIFPSVCYETFGRVVVESYACGVPVLVSRLGAASELVEEGRTGFLFDPNNPSEAVEKIKLLASDGGLRERLGLRARQLYLEKFLPEQNLKLLLDVYNAAVKSGQG